MHESGIRTAGVIKSPFTYEPYPPGIIGDSSGRKVVRHKVEKYFMLTITRDGEEVRDIVEE